jgi:gamma-glutamyltranspeptidase/glutathione hydrolase
MKRLVVILLLLAGTLNASESVTSTVGVSTGSRYATQAAIAVLREGGSAMDAVTAAAFVTAVTRPDAAGIGGGGFILYYDKTEGATWSVDFRETAPWRPEEETTETDSAPPEGPPPAILSVGTPGFVRGLKEAHERFGRKRWKTLLEPAILLAREGFEADTALAAAFSAAEESKTLDSAARAAFLANAKPGTLSGPILQPDLADTIARVAKQSDDFYDGATASKLAEFFGESGGRLTIRDLREYRPVWRAPLRIDLGAFAIQTAPPPSQGGVTIGSMLAILGGYELEDADLDAPGSIHLVAEAARRATFDSRRLVADPAYARIAIGTVLNAGRAEFWRSTIDPDRATPTPSVAASVAQPSDHTSHISVVDADGNFASLTISMSGNFGSGVMVPGTGILLNAALRDFTTGDTPHPNGAEPRKRPATAVTPVILFREGRPVLAAGSSGGDAIATCLTGVIIRITRKGMSLKDAIEAPRVHQPDYPDRMSIEPELERAAAFLEKMGHQVVRVRSIGEINAVMVDGERIISISDPRGKGSTGGF